MIRVTVQRDNERAIVAITIKGHAGAGSHGFDLICAGVSAVSFGAINAVEDLCGFELIVDQAKDGGFLECSFPGGITGVRWENAQLLLEGMLSSLHTMEAAYPEHIKVDK